MELRNEISRMIQRVLAHDAFEREVLDDAEVAEAWMESLRMDYEPLRRSAAA